MSESHVCASGFCSSVSLIVEMLVWNAQSLCLRTEATVDPLPSCCSGPSRGEEHALITSDPLCSACPPQHSCSSVRKTARSALPWPGSSSRNGTVKHTMRYGQYLDFSGLGAFLQHFVVSVKWSEISSAQWEPKLWHHFYLATSTENISFGPFVGIKTCG